MNKQISVIFLVKDPPIDRLAALVEYLRTVADQFIFVVDDRTSKSDVETILTWPGTKVVMFEWHDDFAAARNAALPHVDRPWTLHLDPDELPSVGMIVHLLDTTEPGNREAALAYMYWFENWWGGMKGEQHEYHWHIRLWKSGHAKFYRAVHELVMLDGQYENVTRNKVAIKAPLSAYVIHSKSAERLEVDQAYYDSLGERSK